MISTDFEMGVVGPLNHEQYIGRYRILLQELYSGFRTRYHYLRARHALAKRYGMLRVDEPNVWIAPQIGERDTIPGSIIHYLPHTWNLDIMENSELFNEPKLPELPPSEAGSSSNAEASGEVGPVSDTIASGSKDKGKAREVQVISLNDNDRWVQQGYSFGRVFTHKDYLERLQLLVAERARLGLTPTEYELEQRAIEFQYSMIT